MKHDFMLPDDGRNNEQSLEERFAPIEPTERKIERYRMEITQASIKLARSYIDKIRELQWEIKQEYRKAIELDQTQMTSLDYHNLGVVYERQGEPEATEAFTKATELEAE